jgi:hypothetical protein
MRPYRLLGALALLHLLALLSFFSVPFAMETPKNLLMELFEVDFWVFPAAFISIWGLISLLIVLRHGALHRPGEAWTLRLLALGIFAALTVMALGAMQLAPAALTLYSSFGADLPMPTLVFLDANWAFLLLPAAALMAVGFAFASRDATGRAARFSSGGLVALLVIANASLFGALGSLYLPFFKMCGSPEMDSGFSRLHAAASLGREASVREQLARGADLNARDNQGRTTLDWADNNKQTAVADLLTARGAVRSTKESRQRAVEGAKAKASREDSFGSCSV